LAKLPPVTSYSEGSVLSDRHQDLVGGGSAGSLVKLTLVFSDGSAVNPCDKKTLDADGFLSVAGNGRWLCTNVLDLLSYNNQQLQLTVENKAGQKSSRVLSIAIPEGIQHPVRNTQELGVVSSLLSWFSSEKSAGVLKNSEIVGEQDLVAPVCSPFTESMLDENTGEIKPSCSDAKSGVDESSYVWSPSKLGAGTRSFTVKDNKGNKSEAYSVTVYAVPQYDQSSCVAASGKSFGAWDLGLHQRVKKGVHGRDTSKKVFSLHDPAKDKPVNESCDLVVQRDSSAPTVMINGTLYSAGEPAPLNTTSDYRNTINFDDGVKCDDNQTPPADNQVFPMEVECSSGLNTDLSATFVRLELDGSDTNKASGFGKLWTLTIPRPETTDKTYKLVFNAKDKAGNQMGSLGGAGAHEIAFTVSMQQSVATQIYSAPALPPSPTGTTTTPPVVVVNNYVCDTSSYTYSQAVAYCANGLYTANEMTATLFAGWKSQCPNAQGFWLGGSQPQKAGTDATQVQGFQIMQASILGGSNLGFFCK